MSKTDQIIKLIEEGKSFGEVSALKISKDSYVKQIFTKQGVDWRPRTDRGDGTNGDASDDKQDCPMEEMYHPYSNEDKKTQVLDQDKAMEDMEVKAKSNALAEVMKKLMADPISFLTLAQNIDIPESNIRVKVNKCTRHPHIDVKPGKNCELCLKTIRQYEDDMNQRNFVLPCPKCGDSTRASLGGTIKKLPKRAGHYSCGNCKLTYNAKECVTWDSGKDNAYFDHAAKQGLY